MSANDVIIESKKGVLGRMVKGFTGAFSKKEDNRLGYDLDNAKTTKKRVDILKDFFTSNKNSNVTNIEGTPLMYNSKSIAELEIFIKNNGVDFKGKEKDTMFEKEAKTFFANLSEGNIQKGNLNVLKTLSDNNRYYVALAQNKNFKNLMLYKQI